MGGDIADAPNDDGAENVKRWKTFGVVLLVLFIIAMMTTLL